jgi:hypothetical protein
MSTLLVRYVSGLRVVAAVGAVSLLAACGGGGSGSAAAAQGVASIAASGGTRPAAQQTAPVQTGVLLPVNASEAEAKRIMNAYYSCLQGHGVTGIGTKPNGLMGPENIPHTPLVATAEKDCASKKPHGPWQENPADNPNYQNDMRAWINCMNSRGVPVRAVAGGWNFVSTHVPADESQIELECEMKAFGEN